MVVEIAVPLVANLHAGHHVMDVDLTVHLVQVLVEIIVKQLV